MKVLVTILLLGFSTCTNSERCPPREDLFPCYCENVKDTANIIVHCSEMDFQTLNRSVRSLTGKRNVEIFLKKLDLVSIPSNFFRGIKVIKLVITQCSLKNLTEDKNLPALSGLEDSLEMFSINSSLTDEKGTVSLNITHLQKLEAFDFSFNEITELNDDWFGHGVTSVKDLIVYGNRFKKLGDRAFANFFNLNQFTLNGNNFTTLKRTMFPAPADELKFFTLSENGLANLPDDMFSSMPNLQGVWLNSNNITKLEQKTWERVWEQLDLIDLHDNPLECDSHMTWMTNLRRAHFLHGNCANKPGTSLIKYIDDMKSQ